MRKVIIIGTLLLSLYSNAQITINASDMPQVGYNYLTENILDFVAVDPTLTGANYTWDFSSVIGITTDTIKAIDVLSTPVAYQFYFNNPVLYANYVADYAVAAPDINGGGVVTLNDRYEYFRDDANGHKVVGFGANINAIPTSVKYDQIDIIYDFPMNYGSNSGSDASYIIGIPTMGTYGQDISRQKEVDGWGAVTTPYGTFDCLRVKTTLDITDTIYVDALMFGSSIPRTTELIYDWISIGEGVPVFTVRTTDLGLITSASYKSGHLNSVTTIEKNLFKLYPNPASNQINIETDLRGRLYLYDLTGNLVLQEVFNAYTPIDLSKLNSGLYTITLISESNKIISKKIEIIK